MNRKSFLQTCAFAIAGIALSNNLASCKTKKRTITPGALSKLDAYELANLIQNKQLNPKELLLDTIQRIKAKDDQIGAVSITDFEAALKRAENIDVTLPFAGIPLLLKDGTDFGKVIRPHSSRFFQQYTQLLHFSKKG